MGSLVEHVVARRAIGNAGRAVGAGPSILEGISTQNLPRKHKDKKEETRSLSLVASRRPTIAPLGLENDRRGHVAGLLHCSAALGTRCQTEGEGQTQTIKNETILVNKVPLESKQMIPKLDDGAGGFPPNDGDGGGGGGGGGGGWGQGGFVFWALVLLVGFLRDRELDKPYQQKKPKKMKRPSMA
ncbi:unnamed protein product [Calypogeia fissa]